MEQLVRVKDFEAAAKEVLDGVAWRYLSGGTDDMTLLSRSRAALDSLLLRPRSFLRDVSRLDTAVTLVGDTRLRCPIAISPTACHVVFHPAGEAETARGAAKADALLCLSAWANWDIAKVREECPDAQLWQNVYVWEDRAASQALVRKAEKHGAKALVLTCDAAVEGSRGRFQKDMPRFTQRMSTIMGGNRHQNLPEGWNADYRRWDHGDPSFTWADFAVLVRSTHLPVVAKGITNGSDARAAVEAGAAAVWVSTHGGRQLDSQPASVEVLPEVVRAVGGRVQVYFDSGVRSGADVVKALAMGATTVFVGRPSVYGLAVGGADGVAKVMEILESETAATMKLCGCASLSDIRSSLLIRSSDASKL